MVRSGTQGWREFRREEPHPAEGRCGRGPVTVRIGARVQGWAAWSETSPRAQQRPEREVAALRPPRAETEEGVRRGGEPSSRLTSSGADKVTVGELRLRGRRI